MPLNSPGNDSLNNSSTGTLYIVATPIGNFDDITLRALEILKQVDIIAAEDTRHTRQLLAHFNISARLISCHEHNEQQSAKGIMEKLKTGSSVALVSNAGTPTVSDPGYRIVNAAINEVIPIVPVPGVSAAITALSVSGLPTDAFCFIGFLPAKKQKREARIKQLESISATLIFYESPKRILTVMDEMIQIMGDRHAVLAREMTKSYEEFIRGNLSRLIEALASRNAIKGEITLLVSGHTEKEPFRFEDISDEIESALQNNEMSISKLARKFSSAYGVSKNRMYDKILELKSKMAHGKGENDNG
jgi:16S rRNA (cytidine1402-2'-O)-methyltransferase